MGITSLNKIFNNEKYIFLLLSLIFGIVFIFVKPVFEGWDESAHYYKAAQLAKLNITPQKFNNQVGYFFSPAEVLSVDQSSGRAIDENGNIFISLANTGVYPPVSYIPAAVTIWAANLLKLSPLKIVPVIRLINLFAWIFIIYTAISITPVYKKTMLIVALMPLSLLLASIISADTICNAFAFLFTALILKYAYTDTVQLVPKNIFILFITAILLVMTKGYFFLLLLFLLIPVKKFISQKFYAGSLFLVIFLPLIIILLWTYSNINYVVPLREGVDQAAQFKDILKNPLIFLSYLPEQLYRTIFMPLIEIDIVNNAVSGMLMNNHDYIKYIISSLISGKITILDALKNWSFMEKAISLLTFGFYFVFMLVISLSEGKKEINISIKNKLILLFIYLATFIYVSFGIYLNWTPYGAKEIIGIQSRYFIPILPITLLFFYNNKVKIKLSDDKLNMLIMIFLFTTLITSVSALYIRYYVI